MAKRKHRDYQNSYPSVTTIIGQLSSFALMHWFKITPYDEIIKQSARGKEIGKQMHECIQDFIETGTAKIETEYPQEITTALNSFQLFKKENPKYILKKSELALTSEKYNFNGQVDCICEVNGVLWIADWKSQNIKDKETPSTYDEYLTQVSAYVNLYNECMKENIENAVIVTLAKDKVAYKTYEMTKEEIDGHFNEIFLPLLKIWNYKNQPKKEQKCLTQ